MMLFKKLLVVLILSIISNVSFGQYEDDQRVLMTINGDEVTVAEFMTVYKKNNVNNDVLDKKSLEEYLDLYINFKLKVKEAKDIGMDTAQAFISELEGYRKQLVAPYFIDEEVNEQLMQTAYEHKLIDLRASHILIKVDQYALPEDTLETYNRIIKIRERIINGEDFGEVAAEVSEDPTAKDYPATEKRPARKGNRGDLGYFTVFDMIYPFEVVAYNTKIGEVSMPVRTIYGYHIIMVTDKQEALGKAQVAHIYLKFPPNPTSEDSIRKNKEIYDIYQQLENGENFMELVKKYSDDKGSIERGGVLPWFGSNRMVPEFIASIKTLQDSGDISNPLLTIFGWHIIQLKERRKPGTYEEEKEEIKRRMTKDTRSKKSRESVINKIKKEYGFTEYPDAKEEIYESLDSTFLKNQWTIARAEGLNKTLFEIGNTKYTQQDFAAYLENKQNRRGIKPLKDFFREEYKNFINKQCIAYEDSGLEDKYPEFKILMKEYTEGILLFNLTDQNVWSKAIRDTTGLEAFYEKNKDKYLWGERLEATIYIVNESQDVDEVKKWVKKGLNEEEIIAKFNEDSEVSIFVETKKYSGGDNKLIDKLTWAKGISKNYKIADYPSLKRKKGISDDAIVFVKTNKLHKPQPKEINEVRGLITSDYQNYLEQQWIQSLKKKYKVSVDEEIMSTLK